MGACASRVSRNKYRDWETAISNSIIYVNIIVTSNSLKAVKFITCNYGVSFSDFEPNIVQYIFRNVFGFLRHGVS
jgi:hypothetical protein